MKINSTDFTSPLSLWNVIRTDWKWWLSGAMFSFTLASVLMTGWPAGLLPNLSYPMTYNGDGSFIAIQRLIEGWIFENSRTGYPFGSSLLDYPSSDSGNYLILKLIGTFSGNWYAVLNLYYLLGFAVTFAVSFCVLRTVGLAVPFAFTASTLFSFLAFHFQRIDHLFYTWYFVVPLFYYIALRLFNPNSLKTISTSNSRQKFLFALGLVALGSFGVYYAIFGLIVLSVTIISALLIKHDSSALKLSFLAAFFVAAGVILNLLPNIIHQHINGKNPEVAQRGIGESEVYALKFAQLILPRSAHRNDAMGEITHKYTTETPLSNENGTATLGAIGALGLLAALGIVFSNLVGKPYSNTLNFVSLTVLVLFMFGTIGGGGVIFAQLVTTSIRAWNRISVFISFGALLVFFTLLQTQAQKFYSGRRFVIFSGLISLLLLVAGLYDQTTATCASCNEQIKKAFQMDKEFVQSIEKSLPTHSAIYQLPYMGFPEPPPPYFRLMPYELAQGFLNSSSLQWSYGSMKGREGDLFYRALANEPINKQLDVIKQLGFAGIYIDKRGFEDGGHAVIDALTNILGAPPSLARADGEIVFFRLQQGEAQLSFDGLSAEQIIQKSGYASPPNIANRDMSTDKGKLLLRLFAWLWLGTILYACRHFFTVPDQGNRQAGRFGRKQQFVILVSTILLLVAAALVTRSHRESCPKCFDLWQKFSLGEIKAAYHLVPAKETLVNGLDNFPATLSLGVIQLDLPQSATLKAISVSAIGNNGTDLGNWTTQPFSHLWGVAIQSNSLGGTLLNYGARKEELNLSMDRKFSLLIPDNGNLSKCPDLYVQLFFSDGGHASTLASCN